VSPTRVRNLHVPAMSASPSPCALPAQRHVATIAEAIETRAAGGRLPRHGENMLHGYSPGSDTTVPHVPFVTRVPAKSVPERKPPT